jgi:anaerobic ribonucleoside-triphosphate reductase
MDFLPDKEFHPIFERVSRKVNLKGAGSPAEINERLKKQIKKEKEKTRMIKEAISKGYAEKRALTRWLKKIRMSRKDLKKLIFSGFGRRTIDEAIARPHGKVALTLRHGRKKAKEILLERARRRIGPAQLRRRRKWR